MSKNNTPFKIQRKVPVPKPHRGRGLTATLRACKVGDSFLVPGSISRTGAYTVARHLGVTVAVRQEGEGFRIWRTA